MRALNSALRCRRFRLLILVLFRVGRPQKPAQFINKPLAPFPEATSHGSGGLNLFEEKLRDFVADKSDQVTL